MFCKHCGKEIKDGVSFCPMCGKPTGVTTEPKEKPQNTHNHFQKKKPNLKLLFAILGVVALVLVVGGIGKKISSSNHTQSVANNGTSSKNYTEEGYTKEPSNTTESSDTKDDKEGKSTYKDKKLKKKKSYKQAYKEEYNSFEARIEEYCQQQGEEYAKMVDKVSDSFNEAYERLEKEVPGLSTYIGLDVGTAVSDSYTGIGIVSELTTKAVSNETVRKIGFTTMMYAGTALFDWAMNYTSTDYPFGFELFSLNGDYALLRSNGTYEDMVKIIGNNMSYKTKTEMLTERISELENQSISLQNGEDKDAYAECMGRLDANKALEKEVKEFYNKCLITIACSGKEYGNGEPIKLYWVVGKDGTVTNTFWAPAKTVVPTENVEETVAESRSFDISLCKDGSCFMEDSTKRFVIDKTGNVIFDGNSIEQLKEAPVGESAILTYSPNGKALQKRKVKDSTYGTYYILEIIDKKGKAEKILEVRETQSVVSGFYYPGGIAGEIRWYRSTNGSDYTSLKYETLDGKVEENVINLSDGKLYNKNEFDNNALEKVLKTKEENQVSAQNGTLEDGWAWNAEDGSIFTENDFIFLQGHMFDKGLSDKYSYLNGMDTRFDTSKFVLNNDVFLKSIGESRDVLGCYCKDNVVWVVTRSGYFYTYDLKTKKKIDEVEIGENAPYAFTPYGLLVYGKNEKGKAKTEHESYSGKDTENSVYQYDASGKCIAKYPAYRNHLGDSVYGFLYSNGKDTYNLATQKMFGM